MKKRSRPNVQEDVVCNLIPMVDIMFLLLLFFMLSADMSQREMEDLVLPQGDQVKEDPKEKDNDPRTTINLFHRADSASFECPINKRGGICRNDEHWLIAIRSEEFTLDTVKWTRARWSLLCWCRASLAVGCRQRSTKTTSLRGNALRRGARRGAFG